MMVERSALLTGASGFLGGYLRRALVQGGYRVVTLGRQPDGGDHVVADLATGVPDLSAFPGFDLVVHAAGKAHVVPRNEDEAQAFGAVNLLGTKHLVEAVRSLTHGPKGFVFISTVAVYGRQTGDLICERAPLEASTPYGCAKREAEAFLQGWAETCDVPLLILRPPLVAGIEPPGNLGAMIRAIQKGYYMRIGSGEARRSWVWAGDLASLAARAEGLRGVYNLSDGAHPSFRQIEAMLRRVYGGKRTWVLPPTLAKLMAWGGDVLLGLGLKKVPFHGDRMEKMTLDLTFDDAAARADLGWNPRPIQEHLEEVFLGRH